MESFTSLDAYRSHDLNIAIRTSSGDEINIDLSNEQQLSSQSYQSQTGTAQRLSYASEQAYRFEVKSNGIDAQDRAEIEEFLKLAQPYIDNFLSELDAGSNTTPLSRVHDDINALLSPVKALETNTQNLAKNEIVNLFDQSVNTKTHTEDIFEEARKLLDKILSSFENSFSDYLYA